MLTDSEINILKVKLPKGYYRLIAQKTGLSKTTLRLFFTNKEYYPAVHEAALSLIEEENERLKSLKKRQQQLVQETA